MLKLNLYTQLYYLVLSLFCDTKTFLRATDVEEILKDNEPLWKSANFGGENYYAAISGCLSRLHLGMGALTLVNRNYAGNLYAKGPENRFNECLSEQAQRVLEGIDLDVNNLSDMRRYDECEPKFDYDCKKKLFLNDAQINVLAKEFGTSVYGC